MADVQQMKIGLLLFQGVDELDVTGPWEVFATTDEVLPGATALFAMARTMDPVRGEKGLRFLPDVTFADAPDLDVLIVPGGKGRLEAMRDATVLHFLRLRKPITGRLASVSTGAFLFAEAGFLQDREATTHWLFQKALKAYPGIRVRDARFVDAGDVLTSGGMACGIDLALHIVQTSFGDDVASDVARRMCLAQGDRSA